MHIIVVGGQETGLTLGNWLVSAGHEIAVIDFNTTACEQIDAVLGSVSVFGTSMDTGVLARAGANRADVLMATTRHDHINLAACQIAKHVFEVPRTISIVNDDNHAELFDSLGVDLGINATQLLVDQVQEGLTSQGLVHLMPISGNGTDRALLSFKIPREYGSEERTLRSLKLPEGATVTLVVSRDGRTSLPTDDIIVQAGDELVVIASTDVEEQLRDLLANGPTLNGR
jgi:trk system potassium uptake protein TrkA